MTDRARALFFASLVLIVGEFALPGQQNAASTAEAPAPTVESVQVHHEPFPATYGAWNWLPDWPADKRAEPTADAPLASSRATSRPLFQGNVQSGEPSRFAPSTDALLLLPPSRAPPALS